MTAFCEIDDVLEYIPGLEINSASDVTSASIQGLIDRRYAELVNIAIYRNYTLPVTPSVPLSNIDHLLFQLNVQFPVADLLLRRATDFQPFLFKQLNTHSSIAKKNFRLFELGYYDFAFTSVLPTVRMCTKEDVAVYCPGFILEPNPDRGYGPSESVIEKWIDSESAILYCYASYLGYNTNLGTCTTNQLNIYKNIVVKKVASDLCRSRAVVSSAALDNQSNNLLEEYYNLVQSFLNRDSDHVFI